MAKKTKSKRRREEEEREAEEREEDDLDEDQEESDDEDDEDEEDGADEDGEDDDGDEDGSESGDDEASDGDEGSEAEADEEHSTPANLGHTKYVHAAFFAAGVLVAYLSGKILATIWNSLAEWPEAVRAVPQLLQYSEDERPTYTMLAGALIGVLTVINVYRKEHIRAWAGEVASELSKSTWPDRDTVQNGTVVVLIVSAIITFYIAVLDRFWSFLTGLVYGA